MYRWIATLRVEMSMGFGDPIKFEGSEPTAAKLNLFTFQLLLMTLR